MLPSFASIERLPNGGMSQLSPPPMLFLLITALWLSNGVHAKDGNQIQVLLKGGKSATFTLPTECGMYGQALFCLTSRICDEHCSKLCSRISSHELRNLNILAPEGSRIQELSEDEPLDSNLRLNYYDVEMTGKKPSFCGDYSILQLPIFPVPEWRSYGYQFSRKLYFQNYRDVFAHSQCNQKCIFGCRQVGYDPQIMTALLDRALPDLHVYQCDSVHAWVFFVGIVIIFSVLLVFIACFVRSRMSFIRENTTNTTKTEAV